MEYLKIKRSSRGRYAEMLLIQKSRKYGQVLRETTVPKKKSILIEGAHDSGKSRMISRLFDSALDIWGAKSKLPPIMLNAQQPIGSWVEAGQIEEWYSDRWEKWAKSIEDDPEPPKNPMQTWKQLKPWQRIDLIPEYVADGAVLFIDDAHKLSGRKLLVARQSVMASRLWVASASQLNRIAPNIRQVMLKREPTEIKLKSDVAYDVTTLGMWVVAAVAVMVGWWEVALVIGGLKALSTGRRSARQDA